MGINMRTGAAITLLFFIGTSASARYLGKRIGALSELHHGVRGTVYAVDARTLYIDGFQYDGVGPAAYFYVGTSKTPSATGSIRLRDERGGTSPLRRYRGEGVTISLPDGHTLKDVRWFSVWCDEYSVNFGDVTIPRDAEFPKPAKVGALRGVHGVSSDPVVVVDAQTLLVPNFSYDGEAPDAKFWVGRGDKPSPQGIRIPDENGKEIPLRKYDKKTIVLTLPGDLTVFDIGHFGVWCEAFTVDFGHVTLPRTALANVPPSLKMLGVSPQNRNAALSGPDAVRPTGPHRKLTRLDATTYRPKLALAAGPRAASDHPTTHEHLHRRAYDQSPAQDQTVEQPQKVDIQPSQEIHYQNDQTQYYEPELHLRYQIDQLNQHLERQKQQQLQYQQEQAQNQYLRNQQQYQEEQRQNQYAQQQNLEQQRQNQYAQQQNQQEQQRQNQYSQQQNQQEQQQQNQYSQQQQRPENQYFPDRAAYERQLYERQIYEQQRLAYERELSQRRQAESDEPFRYRLVPYSSEGARDAQA